MIEDSVNVTFCVEEALFLRVNWASFTLILAICTAPAISFPFKSSELLVYSPFAEPKANDPIVVGTNWTEPCAGNDSNEAISLIEAVLFTYTSSNTKAVPFTVDAYLDPPISRTRDLTTPVLFTARVILGSLIGSATVRVPSAITTSEDPLPASTVLGNAAVFVRVTLPPSIL